jgi:hypothetical protein
VSQSSDSTTPDFGDAVVEQMFTNWVEPELVRRGLPVDRSQVRSVLVELSPLDGAVVRLNEEARFIGRAVARRAIEAGEAVTADDIGEIDDFWPDELDGNSGWLGYVVVGDSAVLKFDFRYNKVETQELLELATEFCSAARATADAAPRPALDNLYSAAELAIQAMIRAGAQTVEPNKGHQTRGTWLEIEVQHGNVPQGFHDAYQRLRRERRNARYGEAEASVTAVDLDALIEIVDSMITHGRMRAGLGSLDERGPTSSL